MAAQTSAQKFDMLAPEVQNLLFKTCTEANSNRHPTAHTVHFLVVLLESEDFEISNLLREEGLTAENVRLISYKSLVRRQKYFAKNVPDFSVQIKKAICQVDENDSAEEQVRSLLRTMMAGGKDSSSFINQAVFVRLKINTSILTNALEAQPA